ncbi:MAG: helix-turn-helix domain-containing protein, partial [Acidobacteria bacterium]|nr:helix-turn-helix domain-containing protein [Acidobacteriota bacterium]
MTLRLSMDPYVLETLMPDLIGHDRSPSAFAVYLALWAKTAGRRGASAPVSYATLAEDTGLSKRAVQEAVRHLTRRRLIAVERDSATATPRYAVLR